MGGITLVMNGTDGDANELIVHVKTEFASFNMRSFGNKPLFIDFVSGLQVFSKLANASNFEFQFGGFGCNVAGGAARFNFQHIEFGEIIVGIVVESQCEPSYLNFRTLKNADSATLTFHTQPVLLDNFIVELIDLILGKTNTASLERI